MRNYKKLLKSLVDQGDNIGRPPDPVINVGFDKNY